MNDNDRSMVEDNMELVYYIIRKYYPNHIYDDDVIQEGMLGLCRAVQTFDGEYGVAFSTYASKCIINQIRHYFKKTVKHEHKLSLDYELEVNHDTICTLADMVVGEENVDIHQVDYQTFYDTLNERERSILDLSPNYTQAEISEITGIGASNVSMIRNKLKRRWRRFYGKN